MHALLISDTCLIEYSRMSKRQKLSFLTFEDLPNEIILKIFKFLDIKGVLRCGKVSVRLRGISNDQSLWLKLNLYRKKVPFAFIENAVQNGCELLKLDFTCVTGGKKSEVPWKLKYLKICQPVLPVPWQPSVKLDVGVLQNCHFLQKLSIHDAMLTFENGIEQICQNGGTLRILNLDECIIDNIDNETELIQKLFKKCSQLTELSITGICFGSIPDILNDQQICALFDNLTPNILKLNLKYQECVRDKHVNTLVRRCNKITDLSLTKASITNDSVSSIIKHLKLLEKLDVSFTDIDIPTLGIQLKSIPTLKVLCCCSFYQEDAEEIKNLKLQLPHISINARTPE